MLSKENICRRLKKKIYLLELRNVKILYEKNVQDYGDDDDCNDDGKDVYSQPDGDESC